MRTISELSLPVLGFLGTWQMLLFLGSVWFLVMSRHEKRRLSPAIRALLGFLMVVFNYLSFQFTADMISKKIFHEWAARMERFYAEAPVLIVISVCTIMTVIEVLLLLSSRRWNRTHITSGSIKEAIETLPVGVCAYEASGKITLKNTTMEILCRQLTGKALLNGNEYAQSLTERYSGMAEQMVELPGFGVWSFRKDHISDKKNDFTLLVAYDITEAYQKTQTLQEKRQVVEELNQKLTAYNKRIEAVITEKEILSAKIKIHDELGANLLAIKRYLVTGGDERTKAEILERVNRNIDFLLQQDSAETDEYELMLTTAQALGVTVAIDGILPDTQPHKHITATALHECLTNTIRHAQGTLLQIRVKDTEGITEVEFSNNGRQPAEEIREKGGLSALRTLTEKSHGTMTISSAPRFTLSLSLPKEESDSAI